MFCHIHFVCMLCIHVFRHSPFYLHLKDHSESDLKNFIDKSPRTFNSILKDILKYSYLNVKKLYDFISILFVRYLLDLLSLVYPNIKIKNKGQIWKDIALTSFCGKYFYIEFKTSTPLRDFYFLYLFCSYGSIDLIPIQQK